jgi:hypothetical protein
MRSVKAYTATADVLADEVEKIDSNRETWTENEVHASLETIRDIAVKLADAFEDDNPAGFDRARFFANAGIII